MLARSRGAAREDRVLDTGALRALAHPLRVRIYDILSQYGPQTASSLAERLGESSGSTSYHLRALAKHDLIREVEDRGTGRERWWERPVGGVSFANPRGHGDAGGPLGDAGRHERVPPQPQQQLWTSSTRGIAARRRDPWQDGTLISTATARLTPEQSTELTLAIMALIDETVDNYRNQTGEDVRPVTIRADVFPLPELEGMS